MVRGSGVRLQGDIGELWRHSQKIGLIYRWHLEGWQRDWRLEAERYRLDNGANNARDVHLFLDAKLGILEAQGNIWTDFVADGESHRAIVIKGGALSFERAVPAERELGGVSNRQQSRARHPA